MKRSPSPGSISLCSISPPSPARGEGAHLALTDVELVPVSEKQFLFLVSQTPYFALKVMRVLARRLRATNRTFG